MWVGVAFALAAGMMWGLVFVGPLMLPDYAPALHAFGRYLAFGLIALPLAWWDRAELRKLSRSDWWEAVALSAVGNLLYYLCLASAIQRAGAPLPTMIIGTLPVVIAVTANVLNQARDGRLPWLKLLPSLCIIMVGMACVNQVELNHLLQTDPGEDSVRRYALGALLAVGALMCWTWYPIRNARWLRAHPGRHPRAWATAQGLVTGPMALVGFVAYWGWLHAQGDPFPMPLGPQPLAYVGLMVTIGLLASWVGTLCWNEASQRLTTAMVGQLIVFETLSALAYAFVLRGQWPQPLTVLGIVLLLVGVLWGVRVKPEPPDMLPGPH